MGRCIIVTRALLSPPPPSFRDSIQLLEKCCASLVPSRVCVCVPPIALSALALPSPEHTQVRTSFVRVDDLSFVKEGVSFRWHLFDCLFVCSALNGRWGYRGVLVVRVVEVEECWLIPPFPSSCFGLE